MRPRFTLSNSELPRLPYSFNSHREETFGHLCDSDGHRMGRYKSYREPKRRGFDDDYAPQDRAAGGPPINPRPSTLQASDPIEAIVKWFNAEKGFGFVSVSGGADAFIHIRQLESAGHSSVPEGARVTVRIGQGPKGPDVSEVIEVHTNSTEVANSTEQRFLPPSLRLNEVQHRRERGKDRVGQVVQRHERIWFHWARQRRKGRFRACNGARARRVERAG